MTPISSMGHNNFLLSPLSKEWIWLILWGGGGGLTHKMKILQVAKHSYRQTDRHLSVTGSERPFQLNRESQVGEA